MNLQAQEKRKLVYVEKIQKNIEGQNKWDDFRARRLVAIDQYINARALQSKAHQINVMLLAKQVLREIFKRFDEVRTKKLRDLKINFAMFRIKYQWKMRKKKFQGFDNQLKNKLR